MLLAALILPISAGEKYPDKLRVAGDATTADWNTDNTFLYKLSDKRYEGFVSFTGKEGGELKFQCQNNWNEHWGAETNGDVVDAAGSYKLVYVDAQNPDNKFKPTIKGLYLVTVDATSEGNEEVTFKQWKSDDVYEISNLAGIEVFRDCINKFQQDIKAKLTDNINNAVTSPIGLKDKPYTGEFNGNYKSVMLNIESNQDDQALFGAIANGAYIHDVTVTGSVTGGNYVAGIVGSTRGHSGEVNIFNCINEANITGNTNTAGILGVNMYVDNGEDRTGYCTANIQFCRTTGDVTGTKESALISGWIGIGSIKNCFASGNLQGNENEREFSRYDVCDFLSNVTMTGNSITGGATYYDENSTTYDITNADELLDVATIVNIGNLVSKNFNLTADIDLANKKYIPIGTSDIRYKGTFDGKGFRIKNLRIDTPTKEQGLFSVCANATIQNLIMDKTCSIKCNAEGSFGAAAFVAVCNGNGTLTIRNCANEASISGKVPNKAAFLGFNWCYQNNLSVRIENCYNIADISGGWDNCAIIGWNSSSTCETTNCYNIGEISNVNGDGNCWMRGGISQSAVNCYTTQSCSGISEGLTSSYPSDKVASGELCAKLGFAFRQNIGDGDKDDYPNFEATHGFVTQIGEAGYSTMYNTASDVVIPSGIQAFAGVLNGQSLSLVSIAENIAKEEPVILKGETGLYNFMPTTGVAKSQGNDLKGSDGSVAGGTGIYALARKNNVVGFYPVGSSVKIPEGRAYLQYTSATGEEVKGFTFSFDDDATGISSLLTSSKGEERVFNLAGQRISRPQKGINIINGKKVLF